MIYLSLGSNIGHRLKNLQAAVLLLKERCLTDLRYSMVLETPCILPENAPADWDKPFLNMIVSGKSNSTPEMLFHQIKQIEYELGRPKQYERWSPRIIDIDILLWDDYVIDMPHLKIPHTDLKNRSFLLHLLALMDAEPSLLPYAIDETCFSRSFSLFPSLVGVLNVTSDSFSDGGLYAQTDTAIQQALHLAQSGAMVIDIGAQSTRPEAQLKGPQEEYAILKPVLDGLKPGMEAGTLSISVDTFWPEVIHKLLDNYPIAWINDVKGDLDESTLRRIAESSCTLCCMHSLSIPPHKNNVLPDNNFSMSLLTDWAEKKIAHLFQLGFNKKNLILDPGIGFGKTIRQNIHILQHIEAFKLFGLPVLVGHSRKSYMRAFSTQEAPTRDIETLAISAAIEHKADFLRVHDVEKHMRFFVAYHTTRGG